MLDLSDPQAPACVRRRISLGHRFKRKKWQLWGKSGNTWLLDAFGAFWTPCSQLSIHSWVISEHNIFVRGLWDMDFLWCSYAICFGFDCCQASNAVHANTRNPTHELRRCPIIPDPFTYWIQKASATPIRIWYVMTGDDWCSICLFKNVWLCHLLCEILWHCFRWVGVALSSTWILLQRWYLKEFDPKCILPTSEPSGIPFL